jgi:REP element-mobilizing transposase RayT
MARQLRIEYEGAIYHIISRGNREEDIFTKESDKIKFIEKMVETIKKYKLQLYCYVLMDTHYHFLLSTPLGNLSKSMHYLNTSYSNWFKSKYDLRGSLFQGRYKSILVEKEEYLLLLSCYIHLNPVRAGLVNKPEDYRWSSFRDYVEESKKFSYICTDEIKGLFSNRHSAAYRDFVYSRLDKKYSKEDIYGKYSILGSEKFRKGVLNQVGYKVKDLTVREIPVLKHLSRLESEDIKKLIIETFNVKENELISKRKGNIYRKLYLYGLKMYTELSLNEIGEIFSMDYVAVSQMVRRFLLKAGKDEYIKMLLERFNTEVKNM